MFQKNKLVIIGFLVLFAGCAKKQQEIQVIRFNGIQAIYNLSKSGILFGSNDLNGDMSGLAAENGDLLFVTDGDKLDKILIRYTSNFGKELHFRMDTNQPFMLQLNDSLIALQLSDSAAWTWLEKTPQKELASLHSVSIKLPVTEWQMDQLVRLSGARKQLNLMIEANDSIDQTDRILSLFTPEWLYITTDKSWSPSPEIMRNLQQLQLLGVNCESGKGVNLETFSSLQQLNSLIIEGSPIPDLKSFGNLRRLTLTSNNAISTADLQLPESLTDFFVTNSDSMRDISSLKNLRHLKVIGFTGCSVLSDVSPLEEMKNLIWLSCPPSISQTEIESLIPGLPSLSVLELIHCDSIQNLAILRPANGLKALVVAVPGPKIADLLALKQLSLLVIQPDTGSLGVHQLSELKSGLPNTFIATGHGFCLGSGWIILLFPLVIIGLALMRIRRQKA